ncbi:transposase, partial [Leptospira alexanderi]|uniref:transposase n=1 Tax=Leptospira alexanderi TaxID=100053 RepID=UPI00111593E6
MSWTQRGKGLKNYYPNQIAQGAGGRPRIDDRTVMTAIFYRCKTGIAWRDLPPV